MMKKTSRDHQAFTLIELLIVIAIIAILAAILMPVLSSAKQRADQVYCLNNMRQWALAFRMYSDDNNNYVPEEGDVGQSINWGGSASGLPPYTSTPNFQFAWYNVIPPELGMPTLCQLYGASGHQPMPPLPNSHSIFSCPSAPMPQHIYGYGTTIDPTPTIGKAFFMYGENCRLCINWGTRYNASGQPTNVRQTKMSDIKIPSQTIFLAEVDPDASSGVIDTGGAADGTVGPAESVVSAFYAIARHMKKDVANFAMCDGSSIAIKTNIFWESQSMADGNQSTPAHTGQQEWSAGRQIYWYPSPATPN